MGGHQQRGCARSTVLLIGVMMKHSPYHLKLSLVSTNGLTRNLLALCIAALLLFSSVSSRVIAAAGDLDLTFGTSGKVTTDFSGGDNQAAALALQPDGKIVVAGSAFNVVTGNNDFALARYNPDGSLDSSFGNGGKVTTDHSNPDFLTVVNDRS